MSSESGRAFAFAFFAFFFLLFGAGLFYLGMGTATSLIGLVKNLDGVLGLALIILGIIFVGEALMARLSHRRTTAITRDTTTTTTTTATVAAPE
jgi:hypothetical protein